MQKRRFIQAGIIVCVAGSMGAGALHAHADENDANDEAADGIAYGRDPRQRLDVYAPETKSGDFYGGSWQAGQRADSRPVGEALASKGIMTVAPDYRILSRDHLPRFPRRCRRRALDPRSRT